MYLGGTPKNDIPSSIKKLINYIVENKVARITFKIQKDSEGHKKFMQDVKPAIELKLLRVKHNPINKNEMWVSAGSEIYKQGIGAVSKKEGYHLTATKKKIIQALVDSNLLKGGTKNIVFELEKLSKNEYSYKKYHKYAKASREFSFKPEDKKVKWHYEGKGTVKVT